MTKRWMVAGALVAAAGLTFGTMAFAKRHRGPGGMGMFGGGMLAQMETRLKLTPEQTQQVKSILAAQRSRMKEQMGGRHEDHSALVQAIFSDNPNPAAIQAQVTALQQKHAQMLAEMVGTGVEINKVLTSEQRAELLQAMNEKQEMRGKMREHFKQRRERGTPAPEKSE
ncbi:MAG: Spy/CpxP family protein refolding chaperone [Terriglobales bacterium]